MAPGSRTTQQSPCVNLSVNPTEQDKLVDAQSPGGRFDAGSNKALIPPEAPTPP